VSSEFKAKLYCNRAAAQMGLKNWNQVACAYVSDDVYNMLMHMCIKQCQCDFRL
jgi:23S rRNA maturation mini-RNase III